MNQNAILGKSILTKKVIIFDLLALLAIYLVPVFSHKLSLPVYYIEPMRMAIVFSIIYANFNNSLLIAITLPFFSFLVSAHPVLAKTVLIATELAMNVVLFYWFSKLIKNDTLSLAISILLSKFYYYGIKYILISSAVLGGTLISTPIQVQVIMTGIFIGLFFIVKKYSSEVNK